MLKRKHVAAAAGDALDSVSPYVDQLAHDEKLRERLVAAITAGAAARQRVKRKASFVGLATMLATDPVLRAQVTEVITQLQKVRGRVEKPRSHKLRNLMLVVAGAGAVIAAVPSLRSTVMSKVRGDGDDWSKDGDHGPAAPKTPAYDPTDSASTV
jgi:signal transduction protein with GAF and PtsI domain